jgi:hypothetical protein
VHQRVFGVLRDYPVFARGVGKDAAIQDLGASSTAPQQTSKNPRGRRRSSVSIRALTLSLNEYIALLSHHLITMKTHNYKFDASYHVRALNSSYSEPQNSYTRSHSVLFLIHITRREPQVMAMAISLPFANPLFLSPSLTHSLTLSL